MSLKLLIYLDSSLEVCARKLADRLLLSCVDGSSVSAKAKAQQTFIREQCLRQRDDFALVLDRDGLALHAIDSQGNNLSIRADFHGATTTYRRKQGGGKSQMIAKAVGVKSGVYPNVLDATAGLGRDAFVLASLGCRVTLLERVSFIHALLEDALVQAQRFAVNEDPDLLKILDRMHLVQADARDYMSSYPEVEHPDVVYLDPMFPQRAKSALVKKEMQVLHQLLGTDDNADALLEASLKIARSRVVVKRPRIASALSGPKSSYQLEGKRNRYDVYVL